MPTGASGPGPGRRPSAFGPTVVVAALVLAACGGGGGDRESAIAAFEEANPDVGARESGCVVDELIERHGLDDLDRLLAEPESDAGFEEDQFRAMFRCGVGGDVEQQITEQLTAVGVAPADAPCVASELVSTLTDDDIDVLLSGEITEGFAAKFTTAAAGCGLTGG